MTREQLIAGLEAEVARLRDELAPMEAALLALRKGSSMKKSGATGTRRKRRPMTEDEKRAVSERMKKSWAARKNKKKAKTAAK